MDELENIYIVVCNLNFIKVDPVFCPGCNSPYHPRCGAKSGLTSDGSCIKCCNPRSDTD